MTRNVELLKQVREAINAAPEHFDMDSWFTVVEDGDFDLPMSRELCDVDDIDLTECGTTACLAGWMVHLDPTLPVTDWHDLAEAVGVPANLFVKGFWPRKPEFDLFSSSKTELELATMLLDILIEGGDPWDGERTRV